jgi:hypothetical protein
VIHDFLNFVAPDVAMGDVVEFEMLESYCTAELRNPVVKI